MASIFNSLPNSDSNLIAGAFSKSSWACMQTAVRNFQECTNCSADNLVFNQDNISKFIKWGFYEKKWRHSTIESYLASLSSICKLKHQNDQAFKSYYTKCLLRGTRNVEAIYIPPTTSKGAFNLPLLRILGHQMATQEWEEDKVRIYWSACTVLFWGSLRVGEILSQNDSRFDPLTTLQWGDIVFINNSLRIHVKFPKVFSPSGVKVDLFPVPEEALCPVSCIRSLYSSLSPPPPPHSPVFMFKDRTLLTPSNLNITLRNLLLPIIGQKALNYSSHSFRSAIPSALAENPVLASQNDIMGWGRWGSTAYTNYTKLQLNQRQTTFGKICSLFFSRSAGQNDPV
jgi:hypothetical protein